MLARLGHSPTPVTVTVAVTSVKKIPSDDIYQEAANTSQSKARGGSSRLGKGHPFGRGSPRPCHRLLSSAQNHRQCVFLNTSHAFSLPRLLSQSPPFFFFFKVAHFIRKYRRYIQKLFFVIFS